MNVMTEINHHFTSPFLLTNLTQTYIVAHGYRRGVDPVRYLKKHLPELLLPLFYVLTVIVLPSLHVGGLFHPHECCCENEFRKPVSNVPQVEEKDHGQNHHNENCSICQFISTFTQITEGYDNYAPLSSHVFAETGLRYGFIFSRDIILANPPTAPPVLI